MAFILKDRVKENSTTTGTGNISLGGASATFDTFQSYLTNGDTTYYAIAHTSSGVDEWEVGLGTWNTGNTLSRTTVLAGSSGTSAVNFSAGTKDIFMTYPASKAAVAGEDVTFADITVTGTVDGRDVAADGSKLDGIDTSADVTDATTVAAAGALMKSGGTMTGNLILNADPNAALGAATKQYVDTIASAGIHYHPPVRAEHPSNLNATYNNGSSGVGATLTNAGTNAALVIDSVSMVLNDRVLVANQTDQTQNGVYTVTTVGDGSTAWVLTRSTDTDTAAPSDPDAFGKGDAFFIKEGSTNAGHLDVLSTSGTIVFGTTNIVFSEVAETTVYSGGTGITLTGTTFSIGQDVGTTSNVTFNQVTAAIIGNVTGNLTGDVTGNADTATALETARTIQLSGDVTGSASFDGTANINITAAVQDDSHAHVISNVDGLQSALDAKVPTSRTITAGNGLTGGGDLSANRTLTVGGGSGITVNANDIAIDSSYTGFDGRYYTESEADSRFWNASGDLTITGKHKIIHNNTGTEPYIALTIENTGTSAGLALDCNTGSGRKYELQSNNTGSLIVYDRDAGAYRLTIHNNGAIYNGNSTNRMFADNYHPNADKWTTSRTLSLTGDVTGSVSWDGSGNASLSTTVANDSHTHNRIVEKSTIDYGVGYLQWTDQSGTGGSNGNGGAPSNPTNDWYHHIIASHDNSGGYYVDIAQSFHSDAVYHRRLTNGSLSSWQRFFTDAYHPNADKWTTARTLSLSGDASGSVSWDGSANATLSVTVANDSHSHSNYITSNADDTWSGNISTTSTNGIRFGNPNQSDSNDGYIAAGRFGSGLNIVGTQTSSGTGRQVRIWGEVITDGGNKYWNAGNDGSGSGLDADLLDGYHESSFVRKGVGYTWTATGNSNLLRFQSENAIDTASAYHASLEVFQDNAGADAFMAFHVGGDYAAYFGLHGGINDFVVGGWSKGATYQRVFHDGYHPNADKWTTARTLSLSGDASGSVSWDGSANATLSVTVANDSHTHSWANITNGQRYGYGTQLRPDSASSYGGFQFIGSNGNSAGYLLQTGGSVSGNTTYQPNGITLVADQSWLSLVSRTTSNTGVRISTGASPVVRQTIDSSGNIDFTGASFQYNNNNIWHAGNDGSGSGLDADLLDGVHGSSFLRSDTNDTTSGIITFGPNTGWSKYLKIGGNGNNSDGNSASIGPTNGNLHIDAAQGNFGTYLNFYDGTAGVAFGNGGSLAVAWMGPDGDLWKGSSDNSGSKYWHAGNDGSGSGLDADTVDGSHKSSFLGSHQTSNMIIVNKSYYTTATSTQNQNSGQISYGFGYQIDGGWSHPFPDLIVGYHTGMRLGGHTSYGGVRFYADHPSRTSTRILDVGNGNSNVHAINSFSAGGNITAYSSDKRLKENFKPISTPLEKISKLNGCSFDWIEEIEDLGFTPDMAKNDVGLIAQEVEAVYPQAVAPAPFDHEVDLSDGVFKSKSGKNFLTVKYEKLVPLLVEAVKEQQKQIDELKKRLEAK